MDELSKATTTELQAALTATAATAALEYESDLKEESFTYSDDGYRLSNDEEARTNNTSWNINDISYVFGDNESMINGPKEIEFDDPIKHPDTDDRYDPIKHPNVYGTYSCRWGVLNLLNYYARAVVNRLSQQLISMMRAYDTIIMSRQQCAKYA